MVGKKKDKQEPQAPIDWDPAITLAKAVICALESVRLELRASGESAGSTDRSILRSESVRSMVQAHHHVEVAAKEAEYVR